MASVGNSHFMQEEPMRAAWQMTHFRACVAVYVCMCDALHVNGAGHYLLWRGPFKSLKRLGKANLTQYSPCRLLEKYQKNSARKGFIMMQYRCWKKQRAENMSSSHNRLSMPPCGLLSTDVPSSEVQQMSDAVQEVEVHLTAGMTERGLVAIDLSPILLHCLRVEAV